MMPDDEAVRNTLARYAHLIDDGKRNELGSVFKSDVRLHLFEKTFDGLDSVIEALGGYAPPTGRRHMNFNCEVTTVGDTATAVSDWCLMAPSGGGWVALSMGRYNDRLEKTAVGWRIIERWIRSA